MKTIRYGIAGAIASMAMAAHGASQPPDADQRLQAAQERLEAAAREVAELSMAAGDHGQRTFMMMRDGGDGPMLGLSIETTDQRAANAREGMRVMGVRVMSVSPGGPAATTGLKAGDVLTSFNGKPLKDSSDQTAAEQLIAAIAATKVGESVPIEYLRDGNTVKTTIKPARLPPQVRYSRRIDGTPDLPDLRQLRDFAAPLVGRLAGMQHRDATGFGSAELIELSPALGKYFGTDKGLLVVRAPREAQLKLQDGDVLLDVDGRVPTGVGHAYQILDSYHAGESLKLHIMRQQKRVELQVVIPEGKA